MNFFTKMGLFTKVESMKVASKLLLLLVVMLAGFAAVGATYTLLLNATETIQAEIEQGNQVERQIEDINEHALLARNHLSNFLYSKEQSETEGFEASINRANKLLSQLGATSQHNQVTQQVRLTEQTLKAFHASTNEMVQTQLVIGLDENSGLHGEMRAAVHGVESTLNAIAKKLSTESAKGRRTASTASLSGEVITQKLLTSMLMQRRHEKDFLQRKTTKYVNRMAGEKDNFLKLLKQSKFASSDVTNIRGLMGTYHATFNKVAGSYSTLNENLKAVDVAVASFIPAIDTMTKTVTDVTAATIKAQEQKRSGLTRTFFLVLVGTSVLVVVIAVFLSRSITTPMGQLQETVLQVSEGDMTARARLERSDEIGGLANAFDTLLDERLTQMAEAEREREARLAEAERENTELNNSIVNLLQSVARLSQRDLTARAPVAEDVTGAVSDALNSLAEETGDVLTQVTRISDQVASASRKVKTQSDSVVSLANQEREQVVQTSDELAAAADAMNEIAARARECNTAAENAIQKTQTALETVTGTVEGINATRDIIRETEKRIKRLGERSQEISGVVNLISNIAERTHILALNASMHAASAGEAGRGFAVVADEVQRLAENARQATEQIATLVTNIQTETMDTVTTMNTAITQVVEGSRLAGQAGEQMQETQQTTTELVEAVQQIIDSLQTQASISNELRNRASVIVESTLQTSQELAAQDEQTAQLLNFASRLVDTVGVFTLPGLDGETADESGEVAKPAAGSSNKTEQAEAMAQV